jgi:hypothetical protein
MNSDKHKTKKPAALPELSHLQAGVLQALGSQKRSGKELRQILRKEYGVRQSGPAFYQMMSRLEDGHFVEGEYEYLTIGDQLIKERHYRILGDGVRKLNEAKWFYSRIAVGSAGFEPAAG